MLTGLDHVVCFQFFPYSFPMTIKNPTHVQADLADGTISRVLGIVSREGVSGWTLVEYPSGSRWAYPPMHHALLTGLVAVEASF